MIGDAAPPRVELFIYWHCQPEAAEAATAALAHFQATLQAEHPGVQARRYIRRDEIRDKATLMESYAAPPEGLSPTLQALIAARGDEVLQPWRLGPRHVERFEPLGP